MMYERLARLVGLDSFMLQSGHSISYMSHRSFKNKVRVKSFMTSIKPISPAIRATGLLIKHRWLVNKVNQHKIALTSDIGVPGIRLFYELVTILHTDKMATIRIIADKLSMEAINYFVEKELQHIVSLVPKEGIESEFLGALWQINQLVRESVIEKLYEKSSEGRSSIDEKVKLSELM